MFSKSPWTDVYPVISWSIIEGDVVGMMTLCIKAKLPITATETQPQMISPPWKYPASQHGESIFPEKNKNPFKSCRSANVLKAHCFPVTQGGQKPLNPHVVLCSFLPPAKDWGRINRAVGLHSMGVGYPQNPRPSGFKANTEIASPTAFPNRVIYVVCIFQRVFLYPLATCLCLLPHDPIHPSL